MNRISALFSLLLAVLLAAPCVGEVQYQLVDLGLSQGLYSYANDINNAGQIAGYWHDGSLVQAFIWKDGVVTNLGPSRAMSINDLGEAAGDTGSRAWFWRNGVQTLLGNLSGFHNYSEAINNNSQIAGWAEVTPGYCYHAFTWQNGVMTDIGTLGGRQSKAFDINNNGQIVGWANPTNGGYNDAFVWQNGVMTDLGMGEAYGINDNGMVVGMGEPGCASIWQNNIRTDYASLVGYNSMFTAINNAGQAIGYSTGNTKRVFMIQNGAMTDLNTFVPTGSGWVLKTADAINESGYIVGTGVVNGQTRAYLLVPVPEPASIIGLAIGLCGLLWRRKR